LRVPGDRLGTRRADVPIERWIGDAAQFADV